MTKHKAEKIWESREGREGGPMTPSHVGGSL